FVHVLKLGRLAGIIQASAFIVAGERPNGAMAMVKCGFDLVRAVAGEFNCPVWVPVAQLDRASAF
ncbi:MAG: hypothetical protein RL376_19, partial [Verrucomicrobiota bacterium]